MSHCKIFKSAKKGKQSFLVTKALLESLYEKSRKAHKKGALILSIPAEEGFKYSLTCLLTKEKE